MRNTLLNEIRNESQKSENRDYDIYQWLIGVFESDLSDKDVLAKMRDMESRYDEVITEYMSRVDMVDDEECSSDYQDAMRDVETAIQEQKIISNYLSKTKA